MYWSSESPRGERSVISVNKVGLLICDRLSENCSEIAVQSQWEVRLSNLLSE